MAIKKLSCIYSDILSMKRILREINLLRTLSHPNIIAIREVIKGKETEEREKSMAQTEVPVAAPVASAAAVAGDDGAASAGNTPPRPATSHARPASSSSALDVLYIVSEAMPGDLSSLISNPSHSFSDEAIRKITYGILSAVTYLHSLDIMHRDLKPSNVLVDANYEVKICDLGLARVDPASFVDATAEDQEAASALTEQVVSRWYRSPEIMLSKGGYGVAVDVWSVGTILAEVLGRKPLFAGKNVLDQIRLITDVVGRPEDLDSFPAMDNPCRTFLLSLPAASQSALHKLYRDASNFQCLYPFAPRDAIDLLWRLLAFHPRKRLPAYLAMQHDFFVREEGLFQLRDLPERMKTQARLERGSEAMATSWANMHGQLTASQTREKVSAEKAQQEREELQLFLAASSTSDARPPLTKQSSLPHTPIAGADEKPKYLARGISLNSRRRTMESRREATAAAASLAAAADAAAALLPLELPAAPELPANDTSTLSPSSAVPPIILEYHRLSCACKVCTFCHTKSLLRQRLGVYETALARFEAASAAAAAKSKSTATSASSVMDSPEGYNLLREVLNAQIDEFATRSDNFASEGYTTSSSSPPLHPRVQSLLQSAAVVPVSLSVAEQQQSTDAILSSPPPKHSPPLPPHPNPRRSSASPSPSSSPVGRRSPATTAHGAFTHAALHSSVISKAAPWTATATASAKSRSNVPNAFVATSKRGASIRAQMDSTAAPAVVALDPQKKHSHFRSLSLPVWTDMVSAVRGSSGIATSSVPQDATTVGAAPPLKRVSSKPVTVSEESTELQQPALTSPGRSLRTVAAAGLTGAASKSHPTTLSVRRTATLVGMPEAPLMSASTIAGSVDGLLAAFKEKQLPSSHSEVARAEQKEANNNSPDKPAAASSSSPAQHAQTPQQLASLREIAVGPAAMFGRGRSGSGGNGSTAAVATPPAGLPKVHPASSIYRSRSPLPPPQLHTPQAAASFSLVSSPTLSHRVVRGAATSTSSMLMLPPAASPRPPLAPLSPAPGLPPHHLQHPTPPSGSAGDMASPHSANNHSSSSPKPYSQHFAAGGSVAAGATPLSAGGFVQHSSSNHGTPAIVPFSPAVPLLAPSSGRSTLASSRRASRMSLPTNTSFAAHVAANLAPTAAPAQNQISALPTPPRSGAGAAPPIDRLPCIERDRALDRPETERSESGSVVRAARRSRGSLNLRNGVSLAPTAADAQTVVAAAEPVEIPVVVDGSARGVQRRATFTLSVSAFPDIAPSGSTHDSPPKPPAPAAATASPAQHPVNPAPAGGRHLRHTSWSSKSTSAVSHGPSHTDGSLPAPRTLVAAASRSSGSGAPSLDPVFGAMVHPSAAADAPAVASAAFAPFPRRNSHLTAPAATTQSSALSSPLHHPAAPATRELSDASEELFLSGHTFSESSSFRATTTNATHVRRRSNR